MSRNTALAYREQRAVVRDEIHYRGRAILPDGTPLSLLIVNISSMGLMARCEGNFAPGDRLTFVLPVVGGVDAEVRWALGGRIGCELDRAIDLAQYYELLAALLKSGDNASFSR